MAEKTAVKNKDIYTNVVDYSVSSGPRPVLRRVSYTELMSGSIELNGKMVPTAPLSSIKKAREIACVLKEQILKGEFLLTQPVTSLPLTNTVNKLEIRNKTEGELNEED